MHIVPRLPLARVVSAGVDWFTVTATPDEDVDALVRFGMALVRADRARGNRAHQNSWMGYAGERSTYAFWGDCSRGACVRAAGVLADEAFDELRGLRLRCTRLDHQVTVQFPEVLEDVVEAVRDAYIAAAPLLSNPPEWDYHHSSRGGSTFYLGRRANDLWGRIYDKHKQSGGAYPPATFRWELETKKPTSDAHRARLLASADRRATSAATVRAYCTARYVPAPWGDVDGDVLARPPAEQSDDERWRRWAERQVRPGFARRGPRGRDILIRWLLEDHGEGEAA
jgi:hypothetical protein